MNTVRIAPTGIPDYVVNNDLRPTDNADTNLGALFAQRDRPTSLDRAIRRLGKATGDWIKSLARDCFCVLAAPVAVGLLALVKHCNKLAAAHARKAIFPAFTDATQLAETAKTDLAREARICSCSGTDLATPKLRDSGYYDLPSDCLLVGGSSGNQRTWTENEDGILTDTELAKQANFLLANLPTNIKQDIDKHKGVFIDEKTGLVISLILDEQSITGKPRLHIVFPGTGGGGQISGAVGLEQVGSAIGMSGLTTYTPPAFKQAREFVP